MKKKIALMGANGFLAQNLYKRFGKKNKYYLLGKNYSEIFCDYNKIHSIKNVINKYKFDVIINCVGYTKIDNVEIEKELCFKLNVIIVQNIVQAIKEAKIKPFLIHFSTDHLYNQKGNSFENNFQILNYYSLSKYYSEFFASQIKSVILRTNFFGHSLHDTKSSFSDWIINQLSTRKVIKSFNDIYFNPLNFDTLTNLIELIAKKKIPGIFNIGSNNGFSKDKFIKKLCKHKSLDSTLIRTKKSDDFFKIRRPKDMRMNIEKFEKTYQIKLPSLIDEIKKL